MQWRLWYQRRRTRANQFTTAIPREKTQKDVFQQHRCLLINYCQVSKAGGEGVETGPDSQFRRSIRALAPEPKHVVYKQCRSSHGVDLKTCTLIRSLVKCMTEAPDDFQVPIGAPRSKGIRPKGHNIDSSTCWGDLQIVYLVKHESLNVNVFWFQI